MKTTEYYEKLYCLCGCGQKLPIRYFHTKKYLPKYINGHSNRGRSWSEETISKISKSKMLPRIEMHCKNCNEIILIKEHAAKKHCNIICYDIFRKKQKEETIQKKLKLKGQKRSNENYIKMWKNEDFRKRMIEIRNSEEVNKKFRDTAIERYKKDPLSHPNYIMAKKGFVSKPQKFLFQQIQKLFEETGFNVVMEYPVHTGTNTRFIDVAIPTLSLGFEYDGVYWHQDENKDLKRKKEIEEKGWQIFNIKPQTTIGGK